MATLAPANVALSGDRAWLRVAPTSLRGVVPLISAAPLVRRRRCCVLRATANAASVEQQQQQGQGQGKEGEGSVAELTARFGGEGIRFGAGKGGLPVVHLSTASGCSAEIYLFGAVTTSWKLPSGEDLLFVRPDAVFTGEKPISGGIPHCFPQFGPGAMQQHGFARNLSWHVDACEHGSTPSITLALTPSDYSRAMWPHDFKAAFTVTLSDASLATRLTITNTDSQPFAFTTALHSYFHALIGGVRVEGLKGCKTLNKDPDPTNPIAGTEMREEVTFPAFVDCMYLDAPSPLILNNGLGHSIAIHSKGWSDAVSWNPHLTMPACYNDFVCVENAQLSEVQLQPGQQWSAEQRLEPL